MANDTRSATTTAPAKQGGGDGDSKPKGNEAQAKQVQAQAEPPKAADGTKLELDGKFELVPPKQRKVRSGDGTTGRSLRKDDPVFQGLPDIKEVAPGTQIVHKESGRRFSARPAKRCTRCDGSGTYAAHWDEMGPTKNGNSAS